MPLVNVHMSKGRTPDQKKALMEAITEVMHTCADAPRESVRVWITEMEATDFMAGGELLSDKKARLAAEASEREAAETAAEASEAAEREAAAREAEASRAAERETAERERSR